MKIFILSLFCVVAGQTQPPEVTCGLNETFAACKEPCPLSCLDITSDGQEICSMPFPCPPGCDCISEYVRDSNNNCIIKSECPITFGCRGDPNSVSMPCGNPCPNTCDNMHKPWPRPCPAVCLTNGCVCKPGFVKNTLINKCILPEECPPRLCPIDEVHVPCPQYCTFDKDCSSHMEGLIKECDPPPDEPLPCVPTCRCEPGRLRINGTCIFPSDCCPGNQLVLECPGQCERTCTYFPEPGCVQECPLRKCICAVGYVRIGETCEPEELCPCTDPNAVFQRNPLPCPPTCEFPRVPPTCNEVQMPQGCNCKPGYLLNSDGKCVKISDCPCSDRNAIFKADPPGCPPSCDFPKGRKPCNETAPAYGCTCKYGHVLTKSGKCVLPDRCPKITTTPKPTTRKCTTPKCTTPKCTTPKCTTPKCTTPKCTTPKCTSPKCTTSKCTTPKRTTLKCTTPKRTSTYA